VTAPATLTGSTPIPGLDMTRLERLTRAVAAIRAGKPLVHGGALHHPRAVAEGLEFQEHRAWLPGDDPRRLDWRASARSRHPLVRRYRDERAGEWLLCLDRSASMGLVPAVWTRALQVTAGLAYLIMHFEHRVGLALFSDRIDHLVHSGRGDRAFLAVVRLLGQIRPEPTGGGSRPESCLPLLDRGRRAILVSDCLRPDSMLPALARMAATSGGLEVLHLAAPPPVLPLGARMITDGEDGDQRPVTITAASRVAALRHWEDLNRELSAYCHRRRIPYTRVDLESGTDAADGGWESVLLRHLAGQAAAHD
jgi:uncharacterized protein (DUF58 family)